MCGGNGEPACASPPLCNANLSAVTNGQCTDSACAKAAGATCQCGVINPGQEIWFQPNDYDRATSCDGRFFLVIQSDDNLVLYWNGNGALYASNTVNQGGQFAIMQFDGNFVLYQAGGTPVWSTKTDGHPGAYLAIQNDGNMVIYEGANAIWASNTCCH